MIFYPYICLFVFMRIDHIFLSFLIQTDMMSNDPQKNNIYFFHALWFENLWFLTYFVPQIAKWDP